ncbi:hypothetical protein L1049_002024 [Liquidambar formosana]|uniref:MADS-box domain-containing protein n=1 Tax=Liquidambar formosana TaxID=63359 RepID=A0AAP0NGB0_LIQFO
MGSMVSKMGRRKLSMELIQDEKSRYKTFQSRKKSLLKKTYELASLCGIDACVIVFGPKHGNRPIGKDTWPPSSDEVRRIIDMYKAKVVDGKRTVKLSDLHDSLKKMEIQIVRAHRENAKAKYDTSDDTINKLSLDQMRVLLGSLDRKLGVVKSRIDELKKESQQNLEGTSPGMIVCPQSHTSNMHDLDQKSIMDLGVTNQQDHGLGMIVCPQRHTSNLQEFDQKGIMDLGVNQQAASVEPLDVQQPIQCTSDQSPQMLPVEPSPLVSPSMMMMWLNNDDFTQFGNACNSNILYDPYTPQLYHDPTNIMQENMMVNNTGPLSYYPPSLQSVPPYVQYPMMSSVTPQMQSMVPQFDFSYSQINGREANH